jgi:hypothetical protein
MKCGQILHFLVLGGKIMGDESVLLMRNLSTITQESRTTRKRRNVRCATIYCQKVAPDFRMKI